MRKSDVQYGQPYQEYTGTKAAIGALTGLTEGCIAYATDTDELGSYTGTAWVWLPTLPISSNNVSMPKVGTPTLDTLTEDFTTRGSAGVSDGTLTYVAVGSTAVKISVAAGEGYIRTSNDQQAPLVFCKWSASTDLYTFSAPAAGQENVIFIGIEYNAGTPRAVAKTAFTDWNWYDNFPLARCSYDGTTMRILNAYAHAEDTANLTRKWMRLNFPFHREEAPEGAGGLELSVSLRALAMSAGKIWHGYNNYSLGALASGVAFDTHYKRSGGGFNSTIGVTSYPNTQYDNGSGTLATLTNNRHGTLWVYVDVSDGSLDIVYGAVNATSVALAQADTAPTTPAHLSYHGRLIGRIIFKKSDPSPTLVESAWTSTFSASAVGDHALLSNLQGGAASEYYHLTAAQVAAISDGWVAASGWSWASATTITVPTGAAAIYDKGDKIRVTANSVVLYVYVVGIADTLLTVIGNTLTNFTFTTQHYSKTETPHGFPATFATTTTCTGFTVTQTGTVNWWIHGNRIFIRGGFMAGTSNVTTFIMTGFPVAASPAVTLIPCATFGADNGADLAGVLGVNISGTTVTLNSTVLGVAWTAANLKAMYAFAFDYAF